VRYIFNGRAGRKQETNEAKWLAPRDESSLGRVRTSLTSMYGVPYSPNTDINNILFDVVRPSGAGPSIGGEIQTPYRPGPNVRQLGKNFDKSRRIWGQGAIFCPHIETYTIRIVSPRRVQRAGSLGGVKFRPPEVGRWASPMGDLDQAIYR